MTESSLEGLSRERNRPDGATCHRYDRASITAAMFVGVVTVTRVLLAVAVMVTVLGNTRSAANWNVRRDATRTSVPSAFTGKSSEKSGAATLRLPAVASIGVIWTTLTGRVVRMR